MIDLLILLSVSMIVLFIFMSIYMKRFSYYVFSPEAHLLGYLLIFFVFPVFFQYVYIPDQISNYGDVSPYFNLVMIYLLSIFMVFLSVSYLDIFSLVNENHKDYQVIAVCDYKLNQNLCFLLVMYLTLFIYFISQKTSYDLIITDFDQFAMQIRNGGAMYLNILYTIEFIPIIYMVRSRKILYRWLLLYSTCAILLYLMLGARTLVVTTMVAVIIILRIREDFNFTKLLIPLLLMIFLFLSSSIIRTGMESSVIKLGGYFSRNSDQLANTSVIFKGLDDQTISMQYGATLIDAIYYLTPSSMIENKPKSYYPSRLVYGSVAEDTGRTFNFGILGRAVLDFGIYCGVFLVFIFLLIFRYVYRYLDKFNTKYKYIYFLWLYAHLFQIFILGINSHFISVAFFNFCVGYFLFRISSRNNFKINI